MNKKFVSTTVSLAATVLLIFGVSSPASAATDSNTAAVSAEVSRSVPADTSSPGTDAVEDIYSPMDLTPIYRTVVKKSSSSFTIKSTSLATCTAPKGGSCTFTKSFAVTRTIGVSLGLTRSGVSSAYNFSSASTKTLSIACTVNITSAGQIARVYPNGTTYKYQAQKQRAFAPYNSWTTIETSGTLSAFNPTGLSCR